MLYTIAHAEDYTELGNDALSHLIEGFANYPVQMVVMSICVIIPLFLITILVIRKYIPDLLDAYKEIFRQEQKAHLDKNLNNFKEKENVGKSISQVVETGQKNLLDAVLAGQEQTRELMRQLSKDKKELFEEIKRRLPKPSLPELTEEQKAEAIRREQERLAQEQG